MPRLDRRGSCRPRPGGASVLRSHARAPSVEIGHEVGGVRTVRRRARANENVHRRKCGNDPAPGVFPQPTTQAVARDGRPPEAGSNHTKSRMTTVVGAPDDFEPGRPLPSAAGHHRLKLDRARETPVPRKALGRQAPPCFDGIWTVNWRRPFLRRRLRTARPQRVFMRARNPCLRIRRLFRGR
jgi:hypothetical protein